MERKGENVKLLLEHWEDNSLIFLTMLMVLINAYASDFGLRFVSLSMIVLGIITIDGNRLRDLIERTTGSDSYGKERKI